MIIAIKFGNKTKSLSLLTLIQNCKIKYFLSIFNFINTSFFQKRTIKLVTYAKSYTW